jgi:predicted Zn-dependent protease
MQLDSYTTAVAQHNWLLERQIVARVRYADGQWLCEYTTARLNGWKSFGEA